MSICDLSFLISLIDSDDIHHQTCVDWLSRQADPILVPESVISGVGVYLDDRERPDVAEAFLRELSIGRFITPAPHEKDDFLRMADLLEAYRLPTFGIAEAATIAVAERLGETQIASTNLRPFQEIKPYAPPKSILPPGLKMMRLRGRRRIRSQF